MQEPRQRRKTVSPRRKPWGSDLKLPLIAPPRAYEIFLVAFLPPLRGYEELGCIQKNPWPAFLLHTHCQTKVRGCKLHPGRVASQLLIGLEAVLCLMRFLKESAAARRVWSLEIFYSAAATAEAGSTTAEA